MRRTLLDMVQDILSSLESDEVNSINDTTEAQDVARIVRDCYDTLIVEISPKSRKGLFHLDSSTDNQKPVLMTVPKDVSNIEWVKYNVGEDLYDTNFRDLRYIEPQEMIRLTNGLDVDESWVSSMTVDFDGHPFQIKYRSDKFPHYFTSPDDYHILFDSFDKSVENNLTSSRTYCYGDKVSIFKMEDDHIPDLKDKDFPLLFNMAKTQAFLEMKQTENALSANRERKLRLLSKKNRDKTDPRPEIKKNCGFGR